MSVITLPRTRQTWPARQLNRAKHFWDRIDRATGRRKLREGTDYLKALLADVEPSQADRVLIEVIESVERMLNAPSREEALKNDG